MDYSFDVVRLDWQPIERHPRPFRKKNPNDFGRMAFRFCPSLSHMLLGDVSLCRDILFSPGVMG